MANINFLSDTDVEVLRDLIRKFGVTRQNTLDKSVPEASFTGLLFLTPPGGISARTGSSSPWTAGVGLCTQLFMYNDSGTIKIGTRSPTIERYVYNTTTNVLAGDSIIQAKIIDTFFVADVADCSV